MGIKYSFIVPVYNKGKYIKKCLDSLVNQTFSSYEIIIVNDGSPDNSEDIILEFQENYYDKIKYYKTTNNGLSMARNFGISKASGKYFILIDSDDYINEGLLANIDPFLKNEPDLLKFEMVLVNSGGTIKEKNKSICFQNIDGEEAFLRLINSPIMVAACQYVYNIKYWKKQQFYFTKDRYHEDYGLIPWVILKANSVTAIDYDGYYYLQTSNSIMRNNDYSKALKSYNDTKYFTNEYLNNINKLNLKSSTIKIFKSYIVNSFFEQIKKLNQDDKKEAIKYIKENKLSNYLLDNNMSRKIKKIIVKWFPFLYFKG